MAAPFRTVQRKREKVEVGPGVPRVAKLMALAIRFDELLSDGVVRNQAELAELGRVSQARVSQILALLNLAPDIQEAILFLERGTGRERVTERGLREVVGEVDWGRQRAVWRKVASRKDR
jgi:hypothetical protein